MGARNVVRVRWLRRLDQQQRVGAAVVATFAVFILIFALAVRGGGNDAPTVAEATRDDERTTTTERSTTTTLPAVATVASTSSTSSTSTSTTSTTTTSTTVPVVLLETLTQGDQGPEVRELQQLLNQVMGTNLLDDGDYGPATARGVEEFQTSVGLPATGEADHDTRILLAELAVGQIQALREWPLPDVGDGAADGCQVVVVGDSLIAGQHALHERALGEIPCESTVDGVSGRSLISGWQCRVVPNDGSGSTITLLDDPEPFNDSCAPAGLELLRLWSEAGALGDIVVVALGTNDAGLFTEQGWIDHWQAALDLTGERPVVFLTTKARPGASRAAAQDAYSERLREWCAEQPRCALADWALVDEANEPTVYFDSVHLRAAGTEARAAFIRDSVRLLLDDDLEPLPPTTTTTTTTPPPTTTTTTTVPTTTTTTPTTTTTTTTSTTTTTTTTTSTTTTTVAPTSTTTTTTTTAAP